MNTEIPITSLSPDDMHRLVLALSKIADHFGRMIHDII